MAEEVYRACVDNVRELKKHRRRLVMLANRAIREKNTADLDTLTKFYSLLFSAYAENSFLKLIHTSKAFTLQEIADIQSKRNLEEKWKKCVELAFYKINNNANLGEIANKKQTLNRILDKYIIEPSQMRNKVAHGQWKKCLNNDCTKINAEITDEMLYLDFTKVDRYFKIYKEFEQCVLDLLVSPKTHYRDYYSCITKLDDYISATELWTLETKREKLLSSPKVKRASCHKR